MKLCLLNLIRLLMVLIAALCFASLTVAQSPTSQCPPEIVCLTKDEMKFFLGRDDKAKALEKEVDVLHKAIEGDPAAAANPDGTPSPANLGHKGVAHKLEVELAKATGRLTGVEQSNVDQRATIQVLSSNCKARNRIGIVNF